MDDLVDAINALLSLVPEQHRAWVEAFMALAWALGGVLAVARPLLAKWLPAGRARWAIEQADKLLHALTASSARIADRPAPPPKARR